MSDSSSDISDADPPWGSLAAERYLLHHWNRDSTESPDEQRKRLVNAFIHAGPGRSVPYTSPSAAQISDILEPWRTRLQHEVANKDGMSPAICLRTCYRLGSDAIHEDRLGGSIDLEMAIGGDHRLLNDPTHYNYGADWHRVFQVVPELLEPLAPGWAFYEQDQHRAIEALTAYAERGIAAVESRLVENLTGVSQGAPGLGFQGAELEYQIAVVLQSSVHLACVVTWVVIEDEEAFDSGNVGLMFVDALGRVVRWTRIEPAFVCAMGGAWARGSWVEMDEWLEGNIGPEYQMGGSCGGLLFESMRGA
ncbi:hypothetical protein XPA_005791 [Xanthoria parietina]